MVKKFFKVTKNILAAVSVVTLFGGVTAFAYTNESGTFNKGEHGQYYFIVNSNSGMRSCEAKAWGKSSCQYNVKLKTVFYDGQEVVNDTGFQYNNAYVSRSYEWAEDYQVYMAVRYNGQIRADVSFSGS